MSTLVPPIIALVEDAHLREPLQQFADQRNCEIIWSLKIEGVIRQITKLRPAVMLVDLRHKPDEWQAIVKAIRMNPATRRLGVIGFAAGLNDQHRNLAEDLVFDDVFDAQDSPTGKFLTTIAERIQSVERRSDDELQAALLTPCQHSMPLLVYKGIQEFNAGRYYEAHEEFELAWVKEVEIVRNLYQGILQVGVAYYQIQRGSYWGAIKMFLRAFQWLEAMPSTCHGIDIASLRSDARHVWHTLEALGPDAIEHFDQTLFKPIHFDQTFVPQENS